MPGNFVSFQLDISGLSRTLLKVAETIDRSTKASLPDVLDKCIASAAERAPSPDEEYDEIMRGNNSAINLIARAGDQSVQSGKNPRIRFIRSPGMWLRDLVRDPTTSSINLETSTINVGILPALQAGTRFSWMNASIKKATTSTHTLVTGWFEVMEHGGPVTVYSSGSHKLVPDDNRQNRRSSFTKSFRGYRMYSGIDRNIFKNTVQEALGRALRYRMGKYR